MISRASLAILASLTIGAAVWAQESPGGQGAAARVQPGAAVRPPLLREGSTLVGIEGELVPDESGWWVLIAEQVHPQVPRHELVLLPGAVLDEIRQIMSMTDSATPRLEITGEVYLYRGRNFLLPTSVARLTDPRAGDDGDDDQPAAPENDESAVAPSDDDAAAPADAAPADAAPADETSGDDSVEQIIRELTEAVGPLRQRREPPRTSAGTSGPAETVALPAPMLPEGAALLWRRGSLTRSESGAWLFVFDADAQGLADPPVIIMPCQLLDRLEQYAGNAGARAPLLLSGQVHRYGADRYLMPSVFRVPRQRTPLSP